MELLQSSQGHVIGRFSGPGASKLFANETGNHVIQRIPASESKGRKQTSVVAVAVLPLPSESSVNFADKDIEITAQVGSGPGGQHRNKNATAIRAVHKPTGLSVFIDTRSQHSNKKTALRILRARVTALENEKQQSEYGDLRRKRLGSGGRGTKVRTYNLMESRAVDHRTGRKTHDVRGVLEKGKFELLQEKE